MTGDYTGCVWCGQRSLLREFDFQGHEFTLCDRHANYLEVALRGTNTKSNFMVKGLTRIVERRDARSADRIDE